MTKNEFFQKAYERLVETVNNTPETDFDLKCNILKIFNSCSEFITEDDIELYTAFRNGKLRRDFLKWLLLTQDMSDIFFDINWTAIILNSKLRKTKKEDSMNFNELVTEENINKYFNN